MQSPTIPLTSLSKVVNTTTFTSLLLDFSALPPAGDPLVRVLNLMHLILWFTISIGCRNLGPYQFPSTSKRCHREYQISTSVWSVVENLIQQYNIDNIILVDVSMPRIHHVAQFLTPAPAVRVLLLNLNSSALNLLARTRSR